MTPTVNNWNGGTSSNIMSTVDPLLEDYEISEKIFKSRGDQRFNAALLVKAMQLKEFAAQQNYHHFEDTPILQPLLTAAGGPYVAAGPGAAVVVTLDATMVSTIGGTLPAYVGLNLQLPGTYQEVQIMAVNNATPSITLRPKDVTVTLSIAGAIYLATGATSFGDGTTQPQRNNSPLIRRDFSMRILKGGDRYSGSAATNRAKVDMRSIKLSDMMPDVSMPPGIGNSYVLKGQLELDFDIIYQQAIAFYFGQLNTNTNITMSADPNALNGTVWSSEGLYHWVDTVGTTIPYTINSMSFNDFQSIADQMEQNNVSKTTPLMWLLGYQQYTEVEDILSANGFNTAIRFDQDIVNKSLYAGKSKDYNFSMSCITKGGYTMITMQEPMFSDPQSMGAPGYDTPSLGFLIPLEKVTNLESENRVKVERFSAVYKKLEGEDRSYKTWYRDEKTTNYDVKEVEVMVEMSYRFRGVNQMVKFEGTP